MKDKLRELAERWSALAQYGAEYAYRHRDWSIEALQDGCEEHVEGWLKQAAPPAPEKD